MRSEELLSKIEEGIGEKDNVIRCVHKKKELIVMLKDLSKIDFPRLKEFPEIEDVRLKGNILKIATIQPFEDEEDDLMAKNYEELALKIMEYVGGEKNITLFTHCITRLRFNVVDKSKVRLEELKKLKGTIGAQWSGDQLQVIIGTNVGDVYEEILAKTNLKRQEAIDEDMGDNPKFSINTIFETLSACIVPVIPAMCGSGIIKGILIALTTYGLINTESGLYILLNAVSDATFYFLPFLVAYGASKKFETSTVLSMVLAGLYVHPTITALAGENISVVGIPMHLLNYSSTVFPIVISIWIMKYVYRFFEKRIPASIRIVFAPTFTLFIMAFLSLGLVGPIGYYVGYFLAQTINWLFGVAPVIAGFILGAIRPLVILTGMQTVFSPLIANNIAVVGYDVISPVHTAATMAAAGICLGAWLRTKDKDEKGSYLSFFISAFIGITEPALYGLAFRFRKMLMALMIGGGVSGAVSAILGVKKYASGMPSWITFPAYGDTMAQMFISVGVALVLTAVLAYIFGFGEKKE